MKDQDRLEELLGRELAGEPLTAAEQKELDAIATGPLAEERAWMKAVVAEVQAQLTPPVLDMASLSPEEPPPWMLSELEAAVGVQPWAAVKERSAAARVENPKGGSILSSVLMRWVALAAVVIVVALPVGLSLREGGSSSNQVRGWPRDKGIGPIQLAPMGKTAYQQPAFLWLPAPGMTGSLKLTLQADGKIIWTKEGARSPVKLAEATDAPSLQIGVSYTWVVKSADGAKTESTFTLAPDAKAFPIAPETVPAALTLATEAATAGRPGDGITILALLPSELRADEHIRALRKKLTESLLSKPETTAPSAR